MAHCISLAASRPLAAITRSTSQTLFFYTRTTMAKTLNVIPRYTRAASGITKVHTKGAMAPVGPYSQATISPMSAQLVFCSGQLPATASGEIVESSMADKTEACIKALAAVLDEAGSSLDKIVKTTVFLTDMHDFAEMNSVYEKLITHKPARSCVAVKELPKGVNVEIECIAVV